MQLIIVRHGEAGDREDFARTGHPDDKRPLTDKGRKQMEAAAQGLHHLVPSCDVIATSPFTRAAQTAEILAKQYGAEHVDTTSILEPGVSLTTFLSWVRSHDDAQAIIVVGHEPDLGEIATALRLAPDAHEAIQFKKGGACLLEFRGRVEQASGLLQWCLGPKKMAAVCKRMFHSTM